MPSQSTTKITSYKYGFLKSGRTPGPVTYVHLFDNNRWFATVHFYDGNVRAPYIDDRGIIFVFHSSREFGSLVDMLRNEGPIYLHLVKYTDFITVDISTGMESVAEGEMGA